MLNWKQRWCGSGWLNATNLAKSTWAERFRRRTGRLMIFPTNCGCRDLLLRIHLVREILAPIQPAFGSPFAPAVGNSVGRTRTDSLNARRLSGRHSLLGQSPLLGWRFSRWTGSTVPIAPLTLCCRRSAEWPAWRRSRQRFAGVLRATDNAHVFWTPNIRLAKRSGIHTVHPSRRVILSTPSTFAAINVNRSLRRCGGALQ